MNVNDSATGVQDMKIEVFQSEGLISHTKLLANMTASERDEHRIVALATATILMGAAALEALLLEAAYILNPDLYRLDKFRQWRPPKKYEKLKGRKSEEVEKIWNARIAVAHSEPHNERSRFVGEKLNAEGAVWIVEAIASISNEIWGESMPSWFKEGANSA